MKIYFAQIFFSKSGRHYGACYFSAYDAAYYIIEYIENAVGETEDSILERHDNLSRLQRTDGKIIASGNIDGFDYRIIELEPGDTTNLNL